MATNRAIAAVSDAVIQLLESQYSPEDFDGTSLPYKVCLAKDFLTPMDSGVSISSYIKSDLTKRGVENAFKYSP
jgi:hypothetical protein